MGDKNIHKLFDFDTYLSRQRAQLHYCKHIIHNLGECATDVSVLKNRLFRGCDEKTMRTLFDEIISVKCSLMMIASHIDEDLRKAADRHIERAIKRTGGNNE